jgi:hypothetical protein
VKIGKKDRYIQNSRDMFSGNENNQEDGRDWVSSAIT